MRQRLDGYRRSVDKGSKMKDIERDLKFGKWVEWGSVEVASGKGW